MTIHVNGEDIRALHYPRGHTDGDSIVYFTKSNVVHMGDDFVTYGFPFVDLHNGGSVKGMAAAFERTIESLPADVKVIPGHGPISTPDDVRTFVRMLKDTSAVIEKGVKEGKTLQQLQQDNVLDSWQRHSGTFVTTDLWIETLYNEHTSKKPAAGTVQHNCVARCHVLSRPATFNSKWRNHWVDARERDFLLQCLCSRNHGNAGAPRRQH